MKVKLVNDGNLEAISWTVVKIFVTLVVFSLVLPPVSRGWSSRYENGLKTVLPARIRAAQINSISLDFPATALAVRVKAGDRVAQGQLLAEFDNPEVRQNLERAELRMALAKERMKPAKRVTSPVLEEQYRGAMMTRDAAKSRLGSYSIDAFDAAYANARKETANLKKLVDQHLATAQDLQMARKQEQMELRNLHSARENLLRLKQEADAADSQLRMVKLQRDEQPALETGSSRLDLQDAEIALETARAKLASMQVRAPRNGTVLQVSMANGDKVTGGMQLIQMADLSNLIVEVPVTGKVAQSIALGSYVKVAVPMDPPLEIKARVSEVLLVPDQLVQSHVVRIVIQNPAPSTILVGMEGAVEFPHGGRS
jgi:multidrug resistance efflux pump